jgi:predicted deacylase
VIQVLRSRVSGLGPEIPVVSILSGRPGPTAAITANLHGDECTGIGAVFRLAEVLPKALVCGRVFLYSSLNPEGLARGSRALPGIEADLNRAFPGRSGGDRAERHAWRLWREIIARSPDVVIDLHTDSGASIPYAIVDRVVRAASSGLTVLSEYPDDQYLRYRLDHSLPGALINEKGIAAVTLEVGPRGFVTRDAVDIAASGALGILSAVGMADVPASPHESCRSGGRWRRSSGPPITTEGVFIPHIRPGDALDQGDLIGVICALDGRLRQRIVAQKPCFVVSLTERSWVRPGQTCATLGIADRR